MTHTMLTEGQVLTLVPDTSGTRARPYDGGSILGIAGIIVEVKSTDPPALNIIHGLGREPSGMIVVKKDGQSDVWFTDVGDDALTINRENLVNISVMVY